MQTVHLPFSFMVKSTYRFYLQPFVRQQLQTQQPHTTLKVTVDYFNIVKNCISGQQTQKWITILYNY